MRPPKSPLASLRPSLRPPREAPAVTPRALLGLWLVTQALGCAHAPPRRPAAAPVPAAAAPAKPLDLSGTWDWVLRSQNNQGDVRVEQEEWHLTQSGARVQGYYERQVMVMSMDQRPFRCNNALGYTRTIRARLQGELSGDQLVLREVSVDASPSPCDSTARGPQTYQGQSQGDSLLLQPQSGDRQRLTRRLGGAAMASLGAALPPAASQRPVDGVWDWTLRAVDADGDMRDEREEWHLTEQDGEIRGYYERLLRRKRATGVFSCNGAPLIDISTRYTVRGQRFGERISISEIDFQAERHPCENALRRLDSYQGALSPTGQELLLSWGNGSQLLRRR